MNGWLIDSDSIAPSGEVSRAKAAKVAKERRHLFFPFATFESFARHFQNRPLRNLEMGLKIVTPHPGSLRQGGEGEKIREPFTSKVHAARGDARPTGLLEIDPLTVNPVT